MKQVDRNYIKHNIMKTILGILLLMSSFTTFAQFPEPTNFEFGYEYIMIDESEPSNIIINEALPISVNENYLQDKLKNLKL